MGEKHSDYKASIEEFLKLWVQATTIRRKRDILAPKMFD